MNDIYSNIGEAICMIGCLLIFLKAMYRTWRDY